MSTAVCAASRHPDIENVSPGTENVGGTTKGKKFFKSHARRKATNQQDQQETSGKDGQENRRLRRRVRSLLNVIETVFFIKDVWRLTRVLEGRCLT